MIIKVNSLSDKGLIKKLYEAAEAGVEIKMIVRGIFCAEKQKNLQEKNSCHQYCRRIFGTF